MKSKLVERIQRRFGELSEPGVVLDGARLRCIMNLPLLHLMKLADALDSETVGVAIGESWPSSIVDEILLTSDN